MRLQFRSKRNKKQARGAKMIEEEKIMEKRISGHTGLMALFGSPVGHSGSPAMYNFSFQHDGLDYAYMAFDVTVEQMPKVFEAIRLFKMRGGNFTMPCKNIAAELVDKLFDGSASLLFASLVHGKALSREEIDQLKKLVDDLK